MPSSTFEVGSTIAGTYTIEGVLGRGGMGVVLVASHTRLPEKRVAIKVLHAAVDTAENRARFSREAQIASKLAHPNIVHIEDFNVTPDGTPYLVLEYLKGESLAQRLAKGTLALEAALEIVRQVGSALAVAHAKGIVHRDLKPHNIFLVPTTSDGRATEIAKVLDFGISKMVDSTTGITEADTLLGTPQYMAPEQATTKLGPVDTRTDIFAFGAIVYEMLAGTPAFTGATVPEIVFKVVYEEPTALPATVPPAMAEAIARAMAKQGSERFATVNAFVEALTGTRIAEPVVPRLEEHAASAALAPTVDSGTSHAPVIGPTFPNASTPTPQHRPPLAVISFVLALLALGGIGAIAYLTLFRTPPHLDAAAMGTVARQLVSAPQVDLGGKRYPIARTTARQLRYVKFDIAGHAYEAMEQNPDKQTRWGALARAGKQVVQFKDLATNTYIGVTVDGAFQAHDIGPSE